MIWQIVKKQGLILFRNPMQLLLLIGLPLILIAILGTSLGSFMNGDAITFDAKVAFIEHDDEQEQVARFIEEINNSQIPEEAVTAIIAGVEEFTPIQILKEDVFGELKDVLQVVMIKPTEKEHAINDDSFAAVIEVPENFTYDTLQNTFLEKGTTGTLQVYQNEGKEISSTIVENILMQFQDQLTLLAFMGKNDIPAESLQIDSAVLSGEITSIDKQKTITAKNYYAIGMAVMNVLFIASTIGSYAFNEKKTHVFNRIILADVSRWVYFTGVFIVGALFAFIQLLIIFGVSWLIFGVTWPNLLGFFTVSLGLSLAVGGLTVLLTAISYQINSEVITNFFQTVVVTLITFVGGSFFPVGDFSKVIQQIGKFTPNGAGMEAYLSILRGSDVLGVLDHLIFLLVFAVVIIIIAALSFPKRGQTI